ncbi:hypothetical protein NKG94_23875 [Micromonospora sp. M12]
MTLSQTIEDLAFEGISWWLITMQDFAGYPMAARHLDVNTVSLDPPRASRTLPSGRDARGVTIVWVAGKATPSDNLIRFDSPNPGLLTANARAIRRALLLDRLASTYADNPRPWTCSPTRMTRRSSRWPRTRSTRSSPSGGRSASEAAPRGCRATSSAWT